MLYELLIVGTVEKGDSLLSRTEKSIKETNAQNLKVDRMGKKILAYTIKKKSEGNYYLLNFEAEGSAVKSITDKLRLEQEDLLRFLLTRDEKKKPFGKKKRIVVEEKVEEKSKPKVTVAVKSKSSVKSGDKGTKSTKITKGKSKK